VSLFVCEKCHCIENTALGRWWSRNSADIWPDKDLGLALCSECGPSTYRDGTPTRFGQWHGRFEKHMAKKGDRVNNPEAIPT